MTHTEPAQPGSPAASDLLRVGFELVCPHNPRHDLAHVNAHRSQGTTWGRRTVEAAHDHYDHWAAYCRTANPGTGRVRLADLAAALHVTKPTLLELIAAGLPYDAPTGTVLPRQLESWPGLQRGHATPKGWAWTCWPCLRERQHYTSRTALLPYRGLTALLAALALTGTSSRPRVPATRAALAQYTAALDAAPEAASRLQQDFQRTANFNAVRSVPLDARPARPVDQTAHNMRGV